MNNASNLAALSTRRKAVWSQMENAVSQAKRDGYDAGYDKAKQIYTGLVWALSLYGIVMTTAYWVK
jgi:hypothetical protein